MLQMESCAAVERSGAVSMRVSTLESTMGADFCFHAGNMGSYEKIFFLNVLESGTRTIHCSNVKQEDSHDFHAQLSYDI